MTENNDLNTAGQKPQAPMSEPKQENKDCGGKFVKSLVMIFVFSFVISMLSGLYLILSGGLKQASKPAVEADSSDSSSILKFSSRQNNVAVIKIRGVIEEGSDSGFGSKVSASSIAKRIRTLADKKEIKGLLLDINSPGGTVASVQDIYNSILYFKSKKKPVVALMRDVAASGGFYVAMAADKIVAQPGTITGSIGVIMEGANVEGLMQKLGIKVQPIKSGAHKDIGSAFRPMTPEEALLLQQMIDDTYQQFFGVVAANRKAVNPDNLKNYADGRVFTGSQAKALGLIDDLGGEEKAKDYFVKAGIKDPKFVGTGINSLMDLLMLSSGMDSKLGLNKLQEAASPKVYYLWTY